MIMGVSYVHDPDAEVALHHWAGEAGNGTADRCRRS